MGSTEGEAADTLGNAGARAASLGAAPSPEDGGRSAAHAWVNHDVLTRIDALHLTADAAWRTAASTARRRGVWNVWSHVACLRISFFCCP